MSLSLSTACCILGCNLPTPEGKEGDGDIIYMEFSTPHSTPCPKKTERIKKRSEALKAFVSSRGPENAVNGLETRRCTVPVCVYSRPSPRWYWSPRLYRMHTEPGKICSSRRKTSSGFRDDVARCCCLPKIQPCRAKKSLSRLALRESGSWCGALPNNNNKTTGHAFKVHGTARLFIPLITPPK